jgi:hypothetical protein
MANFGITNSTAMGGGNTQQAMAATYKTLIVCGNSTATTAALGAGMLRRGKLYDILVGTNGTPADNFMEFDCTRVTLGTTPAGITTTLITSLSSNFGLDPADNGNFVNAAAINSTAEVGITATTEVWYVGVNQRASYRWVAAPGSELVWPAVSSATASGGLALRSRSGAYTGTATGNILWQEQ